MNILKCLLIGACLCFLSGCATTFTGSRFDASQVEKLRGGKTTKSEVASLLGFPDKITHKMNGATVWTYQDMSSSGLMLFIPFMPISLFQVGEGEQEGNMLNVIMENGVVVDYELTFSRGSYFGRNRTRTFDPEFKKGTTGKEADRQVAGSDQEKTEAEETQYLIFLPDEVMKGLKPGPDMPDQAVKELVKRVGTRGKGRRKLGFMAGVPTWNNENYGPEAHAAELAVEAAIKNDVAIYFLVPTLGGWESRPDMWNYYDKKRAGYDPANAKNVEWSGWNKQAYPHRYRDWGKPEEMPPVICYNCPGVLKEVARIVKERTAPVILKAMARFKDAGKPELFAGVTVGDEQELPDYSNIGRANPTIAAFMDEKGAKRARLGYNALTQLGYSARKPPADFRAELAKVNQKYIETWARCLNEQGVPKEKMYTHIAGAGGCGGDAGNEYGNAPNWIAFNPYSRPGWTTYAMECLEKDFSPLYSLLKENKRKQWASTEANPFMGGSMNVEEFLYRHYAFGATVVVLNTGATSEELSGQLREGVWSREALASFRSFLDGAELKHRPEAANRKDKYNSNAEARDRVQSKVKKARDGIERWQREGRSPQKAGQMMQEEFDPLVKRGDLAGAEKKVDEVLEYLGEEK